MTESEDVEEQEQRRWLLLLNLLFAVTVVVPCGFVVVQRPPDAVGTLLLAGVLVGVYALLFVRPQLRDVDARWPLRLYAVVVTGLYAVLVLREPSFILVLYALLPQFFSILPRWLAMVGVVVLALLPGALGGGIDEGDLFNAVAAVGLGLVVTIIIQTLEDRGEQQRAVIAELEAARVENERLAEEAAAQGRTAGVLAERQRLAHDIHDTLAQGFTSIVTQLEAAEQALAATDPDGATRAASHVARAKRMARDGLAEARRTVEALRPAPLDGADLPEALRLLTRRWAEHRAGDVDAAVVVDGTAAAVPGEVETALLRVAQEALTNVERHARASRVTVTLTYLDDVVLLDVQDDGIGITRTTRTQSDGTRRGFGLTSMRERVALLDGELAVESIPGEGTTVAARVPLPVAQGTATTGERADG